MEKSSYRITKTELMAKGWSTLSKLTVDAKLSDGRHLTLQREVADHGPGACVLAVDIERGMCLLVRQWRAGVAFTGEDGFMIEACAGLLDADDPEGCARREAFEELGVKLGKVEHIGDCFSSPGAVSEKINLFVGYYTAVDRANAGGGLKDEGEDIEVLELPLGQAFAMIAAGAIQDAKTIILLQHVKLQNLDC